MLFDWRWNDLPGSNQNALKQRDCNTNYHITPNREQGFFKSVSQSVLVLFYFSFFQITEAFCKPYIYANISQSFKHSGWVFLHEVVSCKKKINTPRRRDVLSFLCVQTNLKISAESHFSIFTPFLGAAKWDTPSRTCCTVSSLWWVCVSRYILVFQHDSTYRP